MSQAVNFVSIEKQHNINMHVLNEQGNINICHSQLFFLWGGGYNTIPAEKTDEKFSKTAQNYILQLLFLIYYCTKKSKLALTDGLYIMKYIFAEV